MATQVLVPLLGEGVEEVTVTKWLKKEGDAVNELEPLLEVNTDKVDTEIPAPASGTVLKILAQEGVPAKVGAVLAFIGKPGENVEDGGASGVQSLPGHRPPPWSPERSEVGGQVSEAPPRGQTLDKERETLQRQERLTPAQISRDIGFISPVVAKIAAEHGVNLQQVQGTGLNGRITKNDVLNFVESGKAAARPASGTSYLTPDTGSPDTLIKHTAIRRQIAEHMVRSKQTSPHVLTVMEADMGHVAKHRSANKEMYSRDGVNLTFTAYFMMAIVAGLKAYPNVNSSWTDEGILVHKNVNIGMATSLGEEGLIVPVIKGADNLSLLAIARTVNDLASRARAKKLQPEEVKGGTFTLTNHGISGSLFAFPVINQPQSGILGVGAMQKRVVVIDDAIAIRPMVYLSFAFDHRLLDGASADRFLMKIKETLEDWA
jgi:2-oxoglutarate dehydrogenase E2 component (dihydrolipoamide succinyltransferase)